MIKKVLLVYFVIVILILTTYMVDSVLFNGAIDGLTVNEVSIVESDDEVSVETINEKVENNLITGQVVGVDNLVNVQEDPVKETEAEKEPDNSGTSAKLEVSVEVVG